MFDWTIALPVFLTASVEWVEAFTIVLAVSLSIGWRSAIGAAVSALVVLAGMTVLTGGALMAGIDIAALRLAIACCCCCSVCAGSPRRSLVTPA